MRHIIMFSGGIGSWATARQVVHQHGAENVTLLFADVGGDHPSPHVGEDADTYRFIQDAANQLGAQLVTLNAGMTIWEVFKKDRFLGNSRLANCSKYLKQKPCREWLDTNCDPADTTVYVGIDWTETHRLPAIVKAYQPFRAEAPLTEPPYASKDDLIAEAVADGLTPPRAYADGFPHSNCFTPDTRFITSEGIATLGSKVGQKVTVLGRGAGWREATVHSFGIQPVSRLTLGRFSHRKTIEVTRDHLWPVRKASGRTEARWRTTAELEVGQSIASMYGAVRHNVTPSVIGVAAGFTFGDGTAQNMSGQTPPAKAFLCGNKDKALLPYFAGCRTSARRPDVIEVLDLPRSWKQAPSLSESQSYLYGWLSGYFAADGSVCHGSATISSASRENLKLVRDVCARIGIGATPIKTAMRRGYGSEDSPLYSVTLISSTLREDFFIIPEHLARFKKKRALAVNPRPADWRVLSVELDVRMSEVVCAVVPDGEAFTLEDNIYTHNCQGACVRAGQAQWELVLRTRPEVFAYAEAQEQDLRDHLGKDVAILKRTTDGVTTPLTLRRFREELEAQPSMFDELDFGGCGCFIDDPDEAAS